MKKTIFTFFLTMVILPLLQAQVSFDNNAVSVGGTSSTYNFNSFTVPTGDNRVLIVW